MYIYIYSIYIYIVYCIAIIVVYIHQSPIRKALSSCTNIWRVIYTCMWHTKPNLHAAIAYALI